jgi:hypothetical protein
MIIRYGSSAMMRRAGVILASTSALTSALASTAAATATPPGAGSAPASGAEVPAAHSAAKSATTSAPPFGCRTRRNSTVAVSDTRAAMMSVSSTEMKFELTNSALAQLTPQTAATGHTERAPRLPSTMKTSSSGTNTVRKGVCRPTTAPMSSYEILVSVPAVMIGVAMAPKATGAVLATRTVTAARTGVKPSAMSMTPVIATGAPKPASASSRPPKQKAMMIAWTLGSSLISWKVRRRSSNLPLTTVSS